MTTSNLPKPRPAAPSRAGDSRPGAGESRPGAGGRGHRRRRRPKDQARQAGPAPAKVIARAATLPPALDQSKSIEEPLSESELRVMGQHLRFLREHRKVLNLKVNAHEDLLLNGARPPTRRGVCQHLLAKVDRTRVFGAAQRLEPAAATRLVEGVLQISPDVDYLLLYLDCVRRSASQQQAVSALGEALERLDFSQVSAAQLRRVLDLIAELFQGRQRVPVLLGLLAGSAFREAVDHSATELPQSLLELVMPLRAAQAAVLQGKPARFSAEHIERGVELLLDADERALLSHAPAARRRLLNAGIELPPPLLKAARVAKSLGTLLESLRDDGREHGALGMALARALVAAGAEREARELLEALVRRYPDFRQPRRWLEALAAPRLGRVALSDEPRRGGGDARGTGLRDAKAEGRLAALSLDNMQRLSVFVARAPDDHEHRSWFELLGSLSLPSLAPVWDHGTTDDGRPWFALPRLGRSMTGVLRGRPALDRESALRLCAEAAAILAMLAEVGVLLPDADPERFELGDSGRLWLFDVKGGEHRPPSEVRRLHPRHAADLCQKVLDSLRGAAGITDLLERVKAAGTTAELARLLDRYRG